MVGCNSLWSVVVVEYDCDSETASWSCCWLVCKDGAEVIMAVSSANWLQDEFVPVQA